MKRVIIAGGGLAGLTCAKCLSDNGVVSTIVEPSTNLGGRASTFKDAAGDTLEQGLHIFLGTYSEFRQLIADVIGPEEKILFWMDQIKYQEVNGPSATYSLNPLDSPLKTITSVLGNNDYLGPLDKLSVIPLTAPALTSEKNLEKKYDGITVGEWWKKVNGNEKVLERILRPICRAIQFTDVEQFSAYDFLGWVHTSLYHLPSLKFGGYRGARNETIFEPLKKFLTKRKVVFKMNSSVNFVDLAERSERVEGFRTSDDEILRGDAYVLALPAWHLDEVLPDSLKQSPFFSNILSLPTAPAISVQLWLDRPVCHDSNFCLVAGSPACVYQDQRFETYPFEGSRVSVVVAPADELIKLDNEVLAQMTTDSLNGANPDFKAAKILKTVVLKHKKHLIRPLPGVMSRRPTQYTPVANLFLAGDWTQQDFFGSQEGAVRSGKLCAQYLLQSLSNSAVIADASSIKKKKPRKSR